MLVGLMAQGASNDALVRCSFRSPRQDYQSPYTRFVAAGVGIAAGFYLLRSVVHYYGEHLNEANLQHKRSVVKHIYYSITSENLKNELKDSKNSQFKFQADSEAVPVHKVRRESFRTRMGSGRYIIIKKNDMAERNSAPLDLGGQEMKKHKEDALLSAIQEIKPSFNSSCKKELLFVEALKIIGSLCDKNIITDISFLKHMAEGIHNLSLGEIKGLCSYKGQGKGVALWNCMV
ncbi:MAG: hypothetical protein WBQ73_04100, partial [Candidatus Babeliales bacterium]